MKKLSYFLLFSSAFYFAQETPLPKNKLEFKKLPPIVVSKNGFQNIKMNADSISEDKHNPYKILVAKHKNPEKYSLLIAKPKNHHTIQIPNSLEYKSRIVKIEKQK